jgi:hypothetical protein
VFFLLAGLYHLIGLFAEINKEPLWRNGLFVIINLFCFYGLLKRPGYFVYLFGILLLQQVYSHGGDLLNLWSTHKQVDWLSLGVIIYMPLVFVLLVVDTRSKRT